MVREAKNWFILHWSILNCSKTIIKKILLCCSIFNISFYLIDCEIKNTRAKNINFHGNFILTSFQQDRIFWEQFSCFINGLRAKNCEIKFNSSWGERNLYQCWSRSNVCFGLENTFLLWLSNSVNIKVCVFNMFSLIK